MECESAPQPKLACSSVKEDEGARLRKVKGARLRKVKAVRKGAPPEMLWCWTLSCRILIFDGVFVSRCGGVICLRFKNYDEMLWWKGRTRAPICHLISKFKTHRC
jgi:hypothetical protein